RVVPPLAQRRMREDESTRVGHIKQLLLVGNDLVVGPRFEPFLVGLATRVLEYSLLRRREVVHSQRCRIRHLALRASRAQPFLAEQRIEHRRQDGASTDVVGYPLHKEQRKHFYAQATALHI